MPTSPTTLNPPVWVFQIVWPVLYTFMAISAWTLWTHHPQQFSWTPYLIPLAFNTLWFWAVFVQRQYSLAVWILGLNLVVATWSAYRVYRYSPSAARWLLPSLLWLVFAVVWWVEE